MRLKDGFVLREIAGSFMVVPVGRSTQEVPGVIALTETGALLWRMLEKGAEEGDLVRSLLDEYDVSEDRATADVRAFVAKAREQGLLEE
ncbi:PqqD family protein [Thermophilibacter mediterraneus]|uniref:PqqD family protein n=1 Tax=Thermophilibacter mediterraneus TaxID=1871031 RepID=UPI003207C71C